MNKQKKCHFDDGQNPGMPTVDGQNPWMPTKIIIEIEIQWFCRLVLNYKKILVLNWQMNSG